MAEEKTKDLDDVDRWKIELEAATKRQKEFFKTGGKVVERYLDERGSGSGTSAPATENSFRLNLFYQNVYTQLAMLYGRVPQTDVTRKFADSDDDKARVASEMLRRMLDSAIDTPGNGDSDLFRSCLEDRLLPGMGQARIRYEHDTEIVKQRVAQFNEETGLDEIVMRDEEKLVDEQAPLQYVHWRDFRWGYGRIWADVGWVAFDVYLDKEEATAQFDEKVAGTAQYTIRSKGEEDAGNDETKDRPWMKAKFTEIWDKDTRQVMWYNEHAKGIVKTVPDPLQLQGFFPCPPPMAANCTTTLFMPRSDFKMAEDLYNQIDTLQTRISIITKAVKVIGVYDSKQKALARMFKEGTDNDLIPSDEWGSFSEAGGLAGTIDWLPIGEITDALGKLQELRNEHIQLLYQITGMSDILRGASEQYTAASSDQLKAKFASIRVQFLQDDFARFVSDLMSLRAEVVRKHFEPETIYVQSNAQYMVEDQELVEAALQLIKSEEQSLLWRIEVKPETIAMIDYAQLKAERTEYLTAIGAFLQSATSMAENAPEAGPMLLKMLQWGMAGFKGGQQMEGELDKAIEKMKERLENPPEETPNPKLEEIQAKAQAESQKTQEKAQVEMMKMFNQHKSKLTEILAETDSDQRAEQAQAYYNILEREVEFTYDKHLKQMDISKERASAKNV